MTSPSTVSVIIPVRGRHELLERAIRSVLIQDHPAHEILVVDDGSEEPVEETIAPALRASAIFLRYAPGVNAAYARNQGLAAARGAYVAFLDSDDSWDKAHLDNSVAQLSASAWVAVMGAYVAVYANGAQEIYGDSSVEIAPGGMGRYLFEVGGVCRMSTMVVRRERALATGFDASLGKHQDWDFALRLSDGGVIGFKASPSVFVDYGAPARMSGRSNAPASIAFLRKYEFALGPRARAGFLLRAARSAALRADAAGVRRLLELLPDRLTRRQRLRALAARVLALHPLVPAALMRGYFVYRRLVSARRP